MSKLRMKYLLYLPVLVCLILNCGSSIKFNEETESGLFASALKEFNENDFYNSRLKFDRFTRLYAGSTVIDSAQFFLAESYFGLREYISGASEYQNLIRNYPNSRLADLSQYKIAKSYYNLSPTYNLDPKYTIKAMDEFTILMEDYPGSEYIQEAMKQIEKLTNKMSKLRMKYLLYLHILRYCTLRPVPILYSYNIREHRGRCFLLRYSIPFFCTVQHF